MPTGHLKLSWFLSLCVLLIIAFGCSEASTGLPGELTDGDVTAPDGDDSDTDPEGTEIDGDLEPDKEPDADGDVELPDIEPVEGTDDDPGEEAEPAEEEPQCLCDEENDCCDGCNPINEGGSCAADGLDCTIDACTAGQCEHTLAIGYCLIADACFEHDAQNPENECEECNTIRDAQSWSPVDDGLSCDDGDEETTDDACRSGVCAGVDPNCQCAGEDSCCDGCYFINEGLDCDPDGLYCTDDLCNSGFCVHTLAENHCLFDDTCYAQNDPNPDNPCEACDSMAPADWSALPDDSPCEDGNLCTEADACQSGVCESGDAVTCADPEVCHQPGVCDETTGQCSYDPAENGTACDDGNDQTTDDACTDGRCLGSGCECSGINACCDGCNIVNEGGACAADGLHCTSDVCEMGECLHSLLENFCLIDNACVDPGEGNPENICESCNPGANIYAYSPVEDGAVCEDGNLCTSDDACVAGLCSAGDAVICEDPGQCQRTAECMPDTGICEYGNLPDGTSCDDGNDQTGGDRCVEGVCLGEGCECNTVDACCDGCFAINNGGACDEDGISCTTDACNAGLCEHTLTNGFCRIDETCYVNGADNPDNPCQQCLVDVATDIWSAIDNDTPCDDGDLCTTSDSCQAGFCEAGTAVNCAEPEQCSLAGECDPATGLCSFANAPNGTACDDENDQTMNDACADGVCLGEGCECSGVNDCCDGCAIINEGGACADDGLSCTSDVCGGGQCTHQLADTSCLIAGECLDADAVNPLNSCQLCDPAQATDAWTDASDGASCDDGNACTATDTCQAGTCMGAEPVTCDPVGICYDAGVCDPATGQCTTPLKPEGSLCDDGDLCTTGDTCALGECIGVAKTCEPPDDCHDIGVCNPDTGACENPILDNDTVCDIGNPCYVNGLCQNGVCEPGNPVDCNDDNPCTDDTCDPLAQEACVHTPLTGTACDDGNACTLEDICEAGACVPGDLKDCNDENLCTEDICNPADGSCTNPAIPDGGSCDDLDLCTTGDQCLGGVCSGEAVTCTEAEQCFVNPGTCDQATGQCQYDFAADTVACDDNNPNTGGDHCDGAGHCVGADCTCSGVNACCDGCLPLNEGGSCADDGLTCTGETCQAGFCEHPLAEGFCLIGSSCVAAGTPNPANPCQACQPALGTDAYTPLAAGSACDDGLFCNGADTCDSNGACVHEFTDNFPTSCNDDNVCTSDACTETDHCVNTPLSGTTCDDGLWCNGMDYCQDGTCDSHDHPWNPGEAGRCGDTGQDCQVYACVEADQTCVASQAQDGTACSDEGLACTDNICEAGSCTHPLSAGYCLIDGQCQNSGNTNPANYCQWCRPLTADDAWTGKPETMTCPDDGVACTADHCDGAGTCIHDLEADACLIDDACYTNGDPEPDNECLVCDVATAQDAWTPQPEGTPCTDDGFPCTVDTCDGAGLCTHPLPDDICAIDDACWALGEPNPNNPCEICSPGDNQTGWTALADGVSCDDGLFCNGDDSCQAGVCEHTWNDSLPPDCDDGDVCSADSCNELAGGYGCAHNFGAMNGEPCDDANPCSTNDVCHNGACYGAAVVCDDGDQCTTDWCDISDGQCKVTGLPDGSACTADDDLCTWDSCQSGVCTPQPLDCNDDNPCTDDYCDDSVGMCFNDPITGDGECDGNLCTYDRCVDGFCVAAGAGENLCGQPFEAVSDPDYLQDDNCRDDVCNPATGQCNPGGVQTGNDRPILCADDYSSVCQDGPGDADGCCVIENSWAGSTCCGTPQPPSLNDDPGWTGCCVREHWGPVSRYVRNPNGVCEDDGLACTTDECSDGGTCVHVIAGNRCVIDNQCYRRGASNPNNPCERCAPDPANPQSQVSWTPRGVGTACNDNNPCTVGDQCTWNDTGDQIACEGTLADPFVICDDGNQCTIEHCSVQKGGCYYINTPDFFGCDDGDSSTVNDVCLDGMCTHADLNADGYPDIVTGSGELFPGNSTASYAVPMPSPMPPGMCTGVATADFNRDGYIDALLSCLDSSVFIAFGPHLAPVLMVPYLGIGISNRVCTADIDGNGYPDIVLPGMSNDAQVLFNMDGTDNFIPYYFPTGPNTRDCAIADFNGDGKLDVALSQLIISSSGSQLSGVFILFQTMDSDDNPGFLTDNPPRIWMPGGYELEAAQLDPVFDGMRDTGFVDLVVSSIHAPFSAIIRNPGHNATDIHQLPYEMPARGVALADLNGDGIHDILFGGPGGAFSMILDGDLSTGVYTTNMSMPPLASSDVYGVDAGDLNGDGQPDICLAGAPMASYGFAPAFSPLQQLQTFPMPENDITIVGGTEKMQGTPSTCQCGSVTPTVCCDGCMPANEGRYCNADHSRICQGGYCMPVQY